MEEVRLWVGAVVQGRAGWGGVGTCRLVDFEADVSLAAGWVCDETHGDEISL